MAGRKLFLADDSITIQKVINLTFADEGVNVIAVGDGDTAVGRIAEEMPDIVIADVNMPGLNGYQVCEKVRADERTSHIPVLLLVGTFEQFDDAEAARVGANAHLTKPFHSIRQLVNLVTDLIESNRRPADPEPAVEIESPAPIPVEPEDVPEIAPSPQPPGPFDAPIQREPEAISYPTPEIEPSADSPTEEQEPIQTSPAEAEKPEPDDIDRLYLQSIGAEPGPNADELPDYGIDDEMIETSYTAPQPAVEDLDLISPADDQYFEEHFDDSPSEGIQQEPEVRSPYETNDLNVADLPRQDTPSWTDSPNKTERLDPEMVDARMAEVNRQYESAEQSSSTPTQPTSGVRDDTIRMDDRFDAHSSPSVELEDVDLLDIPDGTEVVVTSPADAAEKGATKQVVTLSPELIEMIAQRVVEKLSEKY